MTYEHLGIHNTELAEIIVTYDTATKAAEEITAHFRNQQAAHEAAKTPLENPLGMLEDAKFLCQEILDALDGCPVKMTACQLNKILAAANCDLALAAEMINETMLKPKQGEAMEITLAEIFRAHENDRDITTLAENLDQLKGWIKGGHVHKVWGVAFFAWVNSGKHFSQPVCNALRQDDENIICYGTTDAVKILSDRGVVFKK